MRATVPILLMLAASLPALPAAAEVLVATRTIRAQTLLAPSDLALVAGDAAEGVTLTEAVGREARVTLYEGREVRAADIGPPALIDRNQIVQLLYRSGALTITAEGRSLSRGGAGDSVRVMNLSSKTTVNGKVAPDGTVFVTTN